MSKHTLYLCYFGLREPLVQTQVLPYLREIKKIHGMKTSLLTFEVNPNKTWTTEQIKAERKKLRDEDIEWHFLTYHKRFSAPATLYDVLCGAYFIRKLSRREQIDVLHSRVHVPCLMGAIARKISRQKPKLIFDIRGFFPEEYVDAGVWKENGWLYKSVKKVEKRLLKESDGFVVLTEKARGILFPESLTTGFDKSKKPVEVIPCCVDLTRFEKANDVSRKEIRQKYNLENRRVIVYVGSFGGWYLTDEIIDFFKTIRNKDKSTYALILTQSDSEMISGLLREQGFGEEDFTVKKVAPADIPLYLSASDIAVSFIKACYSKQASSPTKIAEYLASGLPVISNSEIGDLDQLIEGENVGVITRGFSEADYLKAFEKVNNLLADENLQRRCRDAAFKYFDLQNVGGEGYRSLYKRLLADKV